MQPSETRYLPPPPMVELGNDGEIAFWIDELDATPEAIVAAIERVGPARSLVEIALGSPGILTPVF
jgi:hypothetical protein